MIVQANHSAYGSVLIRTNQIAGGAIFDEFMNGLANQIADGAIFNEVTPKALGARPSSLSPYPSHYGRGAIVHDSKYERPGTDQKIFQPPDQIQCELQKINRGKEFGSVSGKESNIYYGCR